MIWYDIWYDMIWYDMIYLLTAIGLSLGGSNTVHMYTQTVHRTIQLHMIWYDMIWYMIWYDMIWYDMIWYDMIWYDMIYLLTAIGLSLGGSNTAHMYTQTIHRTIQTNNK